MCTCELMCVTAIVYVRRCEIDFFLVCVCGGVRVCVCVGVRACVWVWVCGLVCIQGCILIMRNVRQGKKFTR